jgi:hypothetical protein
MNTASVNVVRKCRRCKKESNAARPRRPMTDQDKERLAARDRRGRQRARTVTVTDWTEVDA